MERTTFSTIASGVTMPSGKASRAIYCDLDGVIVDCLHPALLYHGRHDLAADPNYPPSYDWEKDTGLSHREFWDAIDKAGPDWWAGLPFTQFGYRLLVELSDLRLAGHDVQIASKVVGANGCAGKWDWAKQWLPKDMPLHLTTDKSGFAGPGRLLIDDSQENTDAWAAKGGDVILVPASYNRNRNIKTDRLEYILSEMRRLGYMAGTSSAGQISDERVISVVDGDGNRGEFVVKDSGERQVFASGMVRDTAAGKVDYSKIYDGPMADRWAEHLTKAEVKYPDLPDGTPNWMQANGPDELRRFRKSAMRHFRQWYRGDRDEDHASAVFFNVNGAEYVRDRMAAETAATAPMLPLTYRQFQEAFMRLKRATDAEYAYEIVKMHEGCNSLQDVPASRYADLVDSFRRAERDYEMGSQEQSAA
jgi:hypothetical protein